MTDNKIIIFKNNGGFTAIALYICDNISENVVDKTKTHILCSIIVFQ